MNDYIKKFYEIENYFFQNISKESIEINDTITCYISSVNSSNFNIVAQRNVINNINATLENVKKIYSNNSKEFIYVIPHNLINKEILNILHERGFEEIDESTAMMIDIKNFTFNKHNNLEILEDKNLNFWQQPICEAFEATEEIITEYVKVHQKLNSYHFVVLINNNPVSALTLTINNNLARIDDVATKIEFQNNGYATSLISQALLKAKSLGIEICFLEASKAGLNIYKKIGFQELFNNKIFSLKS